MKIVIIVAFGALLLESSLASAEIQGGDLPTKSSWSNSVFANQGRSVTSGRLATFPEITSIGAGPKGDLVRAFSIAFSDGSVWCHFYGSDGQALGESSLFKRVIDGVEPGAIAWTFLYSGLSQSAVYAEDAYVIKCRSNADGSMDLEITDSRVVKHLFGLWHTAESESGIWHFDRLR
jgi:hypothetical protein